MSGMESEFMAGRQDEESMDAPVVRAPRPDGKARETKRIGDDHCLRMFRTGETLVVPVIRAGGAHVVLGIRTAETPVLLVRMRGG